MESAVLCSFGIAYPDIHFNIDRYGGYEWRIRMPDIYAGYECRIPMPSDLFVYNICF